jgi:acyl-lipid omega-6 desaturase (Delta-12 desaturase)
MPQYVLSQHHNYHHADNGNWDKFRGPYTTLSVDAYAAMTDAQQRGIDASGASRPRPLSALFI